MASKLTRRERGLIRYYGMRAVIEADARREIIVKMNKGAVLLRFTIAEAYAMQRMDGNNSENLSIELGLPWRFPET